MNIMKNELLFQAKNTINSVIYNSHSIEKVIIAMKISYVISYLIYQFRPQKDSF
jgi:hypothetical protein